MHKAIFSCEACCADNSDQLLLTRIEQIETHSCAEHVLLPGREACIE